MKTAVVLMNLGTPAQPTPVAIRRYLREFLSDRRVVEIPRAVWYPILYGIILTLRPRRLAPAYAEMWHRYGDSPLRAITRQQVEKLQRHWLAQSSDAPIVRFAMTYGEPKLSNVVSELRASGVEHILVVPLYPQYSATTAGPIYDQVASLFQSQRDVPSVSIVKNYYRHPQYVEALAESVRAHWGQQGRAQRLLMSFHGIPKRNIDLGDPYQNQCEATARALAAALQLRDDEWQISFQSRLGRAEWLQPYTAEILQRWGEQKLASVDVICPAFAADCLETLEEIAIENRDRFQRAGGGEYRYIPCLNDADSHIELLRQLAIQHLPR